MAGFRQFMQEESDYETHEHMLDYVINRWMTQMIFLGTQLRLAMLLLLCQMDQGEIKSWGESKENR